MKAALRRILEFETTNPDEFVERLSTVAPSIAVEPWKTGPFRAKTRMCRLSGMSLFLPGLTNGHVLRDEEGDYTGITVALSGSFQTAHQGKPMILRQGRHTS